jgi:hypothetical protein
MGPKEPDGGGVMATLRDTCADCGAEITLEVDAEKLTQGEVWKARRYKECTERWANQWE